MKKRVEENSSVNHYYRPMLPFLFRLLKFSENQKFPEVCRSNKLETLVWNRLKTS